MGAISLTFWHVYFPYQPIYAWLAGLFALGTAGDILGARFLNALIALAIAVLLCFWGRWRLGAIPAWFGALIFLCYSQSIIHFRWIYPHNLVALGFTVSLLSLLRSSRPAHDWSSRSGARHCRRSPSPFQSRRISSPPMPHQEATGLATAGSASCDGHHCYFSLCQLEVLAEALAL